ncbi:hypothetical protein ES702_02145 [subsurface metagenome]
MAPLPKSAMARRIIRNYERDEFNNIIIHGTPRIGKSAYIIKVMKQVMLYLWGVDANRWKHFKPYFGWDPKENVNAWIDLTERLPFFVWDDAGYWLHSLNWTDPLLQAIQKYFNVIGTDINTIILTTPSPTWILSKIANMPGTLRTKIVKRQGGIRDDPSTKWGRLAITYEPWKTPDMKKHGVNKRFKDNFNCYIPDEIYKEYYPIRKHYAMQAKLAIREALLVQERMKSIEGLKNEGRLRRLLAEELKIKKKLDKVIKDEGGALEVASIV